MTSTKKCDSASSLKREPKLKLRCSFGGDGAVDSILASHIERQLQIKG